MKPFFISGRLILMLSILVSCGSSGSDNNRLLDISPGNTLHFKKYIFNDTQGTGLDAFSFLMPLDWQFEGEMNWILDNPAMPSVTKFRVFNPKGKEEFEVFANQCYFYTTNQQLLSMFPPGSKYFGSTVKQPVTAQYTLRNIILPQYRDDATNRQILKDENLPELAQALGAGKQMQGYTTSGAKFRVSYILSDIPIEEEFYAVTEQYSFPVNSMYGTFYNTIWYVDYIFSFKAEKGKLENYTNIFQTITSSFKINPQWYAKYTNIIEYMAQQQITQIKNTGEFSRLLSRMSDQISDEKMQQFESHGNVYDKVAQKFSDNTLGIDRYYDPHEGRDVELPSGYNHAWSNNKGEYIVS